YIDGIKVTQVDSKATEFLLFMQGDLDFMNGIDASFKDQVLSKKGILKDEYNGKIALQKHAYLNVEYLGFLIDDEKNPQKILLNKKIRQAINYGFDRKKLVTYLRNNIGIAANAGIIPISLQGFDSSVVKGYSYQPELAKKLIEEVSTVSGKLPTITLLSNDNYSDRCSFIASQLSNLGLDIKIEIMQPALLREQMSNSNAPFFWATWIADYPDAESYLTMFYGKNTAPPNYTRFKNETFDRLYEQSLTESDEKTKIALYQQMDRIIIEEAPCVPLFYDEVMHFLNKRVSNWKTNSLNLLEIKEVKIK
ncbi:MAG TPA: ABC transporter substrate-binding protein, partial [Prolixibacteraceae bacterium]|nr:ABC transporter substrate-binding protein [Prolixibacteraceae bacterium]